MTNSIMENTSYDLLHNVNHNDYNHMTYSIWVYDLLTYYDVLRAHNFDGLARKKPGIISIHVEVNKVGS